MIPLHRFARNPGRAFPALIVLSLLAVFSGCATAPVTYKTHVSAPARVPNLRAVVVAPLDAELSELTAGGVSEKREDWTVTATANLNAALAAETGWKPSTALTPEQLAKVQDETDDVQALLRAITLNHLVNTVPGRGVPFPTREQALTYNTDPLTAHTGLLGSDAVLFVFVRDSYATAGRKSLVALSVLSAALTGVYIVPAMGSDVMSAALVDGNGQVLWFNYQIGGADPRTPEGARTVAHALLTGLPARKLWRQTPFP